MKRKIKLTEAQMHRVLNESVNKVLNEGVHWANDESPWVDIRNEYDAETILGELEHWLSNDVLDEFAEDFKNLYE